MENTSSNQTLAQPSAKAFAQFSYPEKGAGTEAGSAVAAKPSLASVADAPRIGEDELARLISEARAEGMRQATESARQKFEQERGQVQRQVTALVESFKKEQQEYFFHIETKLVDFSLAIARRILHREAQVDKMLLAGLAKAMIEQVKQATTIKVCVRPEAAPGWRQYFESDPKVEILEEPALSPDEFKLQTELGETKIGIERQLKELEQGFFDILAQRPASR